MCGLALSNLKRVDLEHRQRRLEEEVQAAREAQLLILPPEHGVVGGIEYAMRMRPGQFVAGDLFEVIALDEHRTAVCIGDVAGHGVDAGVLMAASQSHLNAALQQLRDLIHIRIQQTGPPRARFQLAGSPILVLL